MTIQPQDQSDGQGSSLPSTAQFDSSPPQPPIPSHRQAENCPACGAPAHPGQAICAECGTVLHSQPKQIRCRHCGQKGSSAYTLCPHCGRALAPAPPLWLTWGVPVALVLLFVLVLVGRMESGPLESGPLQWVEQQMAGAVAVVENPILTPIRAGAQAQSEDPLPAREEGEAALALVASTETPTPQATDSPESTATPEPSATATARPAATDTPTATVSPTVLLTVSPTDTASATVTAIRAATLTATRTATSAAAESASRAYTVQEGDTAFSIAAQFQIAVTDLLRANQLAPVQALRLTAGDVLEIPGAETGASAQPTATASSTPSATATSAPSSTPRPTPRPTQTSTALVAQPGQRLYTVVSGDTFVGIALRFNISTEALLAANGLTIDDAKDLQLGQQLIIPAPAPGQPVPPTATSTPGIRRYIVQAGDTIVAIAARNGISSNLLLAANGMTAAQAPNIRPGDELLIPPPGYVPPTPTPRPTVAPTATPTPKITIRLDAPALIDPAQDINVPCRSEKYMRWHPVNGMAPEDVYIIFLGYINSDPDEEGNVVVVPLLEQRTGQRDSWQMDRSYCNLAPQTFGRRWRWYVQIFEGDTPVSPPSETWEFSWQ